MADYTIVYADDMDEYPDVIPFETPSMRLQTSNAPTLPVRVDNPPYILVRLADLTPGDVIGCGIRGGYLAKEIWHISARYTSALAYDPFVWRTIVFTDGSVDALATIALLEVRGGPKFNQRNNPDVVAHIAHNNTYVWKGEN